MVPTNYIQNFALELIPSQKMTPNGWYGFNCVACTYRGEPTPDTKKRMGLKFEPDGSCRFNCFRCGFGCSWTPGQNLSRNFKQLILWLGGTKKDIQEANLECLKIRQDYQKDFTAEKKAIELHQTTLPDNCNTLDYWASQDNPPEKFIQALEYIINRNQNFVEWFKNFQWSPSYPDHIIMPVTFEGKVYGWSARLTRPPKHKNEPRYYNVNESKFLFNGDLLQEEGTNYLIVTEGPLDAIAVRGVAVMGNQISDLQLKWLKACDKEIIVLPDRDAGGQKLIDLALKHGWAVSFPAVEGLKIKDGLDMVNYFGRLMAVKMIFDSAHTNHLKINVLRKNWIV